jgi:hypothetical protein
VGAMSGSIGAGFGLFWSGICPGREDGLLLPAWVVGLILFWVLH